MKHTKGPWKILPRNRNLANGRGPGYDVQKDDPDGLGEIICDRAMLADALLIAAAPDLLEALKMFLDLYGGHAADDAREQRYEIIAARRAIAKAEREVR